ncbi:hypothetical protein Poli38472_007035 [Pythium oligandrum]|uniref:NADP-dependent oxidoreductase domain-containing protein n=1 Tax=Pythium oligandrum TaxID=41045 RepID=A0A8K1FCZ6_PYTOL|nr:hypothetical protein Poli38472_007035 [Pythium oligandrum]|eukprot:TMW58890.1 hypothetical protein Poli38472_007035 [Pythium oligandrum]
MSSTNSNNTTPMKYRFLGDSGLLVSQFSLGSWVTCENPAALDNAYEIIVQGYKHGINFWDTAESYGNGVAEETLGQLLRRGVEDKVWTREDLVIVTKIYLGTKEGPNARGLSRKHLIEGTKASLKRMQLDYVDVLFCHRPDPTTPIEETVRAMNFIINQGWVFYWGTSEWLSSEILEACEIADRLGLIRPICEQPEYNLFERSRVEMDYVPLYQKYKLGLTTWSPLKLGLLTGKYANGIPEGARLGMNPFFLTLLKGDMTEVAQKVEQLRPIATELDCSLAQLALAWCTSNERVSSVILGASSLKQLEENIKALEVVPKLTAEVKARIDAIIQCELKVPTHDIFATIRNKYL